MDLLNRADLFQRGRDYIVARARRIEASIVNTDGSDANLFVGSMSFVGAAVMRQLARSMKNQNLATVTEDEALDRWVLDRYTELRKGASASLGSVNFFRSTAVGGGGSIPAGTVLTTLSGIEYVTTTEAVFAAADLLRPASVRSVQAGLQYKVGKNAIRKFKVPSAIFDPTIQVTNPLVTAGGEDRESGPVFKERMRDFWRTVRRGTRGAIEFGAKETLGVESAFALEALTLGAQPARVVSLYFADGSGVASKELGDAVLAKLEDFRCAGIAVLPELSTPQIVSIVMKLAFQAGVETALLSQTVRAAVVGFVNSLGANQVLELGKLMALLVRYESQGLVTKDSSFIEPVGNVEPDLGKSIRTTLSNVSITS